MENKLLKNKTVVVVGANGLLGRELVTAISSAGANVALADINFPKGTVKKGRLHPGRGSLISVKLDITSGSSVRNAIAEVEKCFGGIDAVVNTAYPRNKKFGRKFEEVEYADFCENVNMHLGGYFLVSQQFAEHFRKQRHGNVLNISSIYGVVPPRFEIYEGTPMTIPVEYAAIKSALLMLTQYMAKYYAGTNVRFNAVSPGGILDNQPSSFLAAYRRQCLNKGMLRGIDIAGTVVFLLSEMSTFINGQNIVVDDGFSL